MKICWIKAGGVVPLDYGGRIRSFQMVKALAERHQVTLVTFYREQADDAHPALRSLFHKLVLVPLRLPAARSWGDVRMYASTFFSGLPHTMAKYYQPVLRQAVDDLMRNDAFDVVVCDFVFPAGLLDWSGRVKTVLFTHNVEAEVWERQARVARSWVERLASRLEYRAMTKAEEKYLRLADHVVAVSERNKEVFAKWIPAEKITVVSTGVDAEYFRPSPESELPNQVVFTGSYDWMPNRDAAEWYFQDIRPLIRERIPDLVSWMVGKAPTASMERFAAEDPGFKVSGRVDDVRPYIAQCPVYIVPMRSGSGTRLKIFEAMAAGKAIVSTPTGAEGLPVKHERDILLAETAQEFAQQVTRALKDGALRQRLGAAARALVEERFSWQRVGEEFEAILQRVTHKVPQEQPTPP
jgi:sugar transferase (PEP-CTERM/EpsH1 system associated)